MTPTSLQTYEEDLVRLSSIGSQVIRQDLAPVTGSATFQNLEQIIMNPVALAPD